jgi:hypothetical protein
VPDNNSATLSKEANEMNELPPPQPFFGTTPPNRLPAIDSARLARNWRAIVVELDAPRLSRVERALRTVGLPSHVTRLMVATPALRRSWFVALGLVVLIGLSVTDGTNPRSSAFGLLLLAPFGPMLGVALAYGSTNDPAHEIHVATAASGLRLILTRVAAVMGVAIPLTTLSALLSPVTRPWAGAWLLPALAVSTAALALMTYVAPRIAAMATAVGWVALNVVARAVTNDALAAFVPVAQAISLLATILFGAVVVLRRSAFERLAVR